MKSRLGDVLACLDDLEDAVWEPYRHDGAGRPPRNPVGILKALTVKRVRNIPSDRELYRRLWNDPELRHVCDIEEHEKPYHPSARASHSRRYQNTILLNRFLSYNINFLNVYSYSLLPEFLSNFLYGFSVQLDNAYMADRC